jgi:NAD(P)-dependent dehydrogenase (short-subunit alcohol dehydrogenase family)
LKERFPDINYRTLQIDLSSQESVRKAAAEVLSWTEIPSIDILVNNAGVMNLPDRILSEDGIEMQLAINHIGHFLFTCLIMPKLIKGAEGRPKGSTRIINISSGAATVACMRWSDINFEKVNKDLPANEQPTYHVLKGFGETDPENKAYSGIAAYGQSKLSNVLFTVGLTHRLLESHGILSVAVHPGVMKTELERHYSPASLAALTAMIEKGFFSYRSIEAGAGSVLVAALDTKLAEETGKEGSSLENYGSFVADAQISDKAAFSTAESEKLWLLSEKLVKQEFTW